MMIEHIKSFDFCVYVYRTKTKKKDEQILPIRFCLFD